MKINWKKILLVSSLVMMVIGVCFAWGFWAHQRINRLAIFTLPPEMIGFYKENIEFITQHAVDPDKRRYSDPAEAPRHYIDLDSYDKAPFDSVPRHWDDAVAKYSIDTLNRHGIVPWYINLMLYKLTEAFKQKSKWKILYYSADIGHYIADAHVPLHCTHNYNGQFTDQTGIHGFWESRVPELYGDQYDYFVGKATYIDKPLDYIWKTVLLSASEVDSVLSFEKQLTTTFPSDQKFTYEQRGQTMVRTYSVDFSAAYQKMLNGMQERKMRDAIISVGSFWYTAWVNAGQPDLSSLSNAAPTAEEQLEIDNMEQQWRNGKIIGRDESQ